MKRALILLVLLGSTALAQPAPPPGPPPMPPPPTTVPYRFGWTWGFSLGLGAMYAHCDGCGSYGGAAAEGHAGLFVTPQLAIMGEVEGMETTFNDSSSLTHLAATIGARYYAMNRFWFEGGIGFGHLEGTDASNSIFFATQSAFSLTVGVGVELLQAPRFSIDVMARDVSTFYDPAIHNVSASVGFNWF